MTVKEILLNSCDDLIDWIIDDEAGEKVFDRPRALKVLNSLKTDIYDSEE